MNEIKEKQVLFYCYIGQELANIFFLLMDQTVNIFSFEVTSSGLCSFLPAPVIF